MTKIVKIPEVLFFQEGPGVRNTQFRTSGVKLLNVGNINDGKINLATTKIHISEEEAYGKYKHFLANEGDLVIASSGIVVSNFHNKIAFIEGHHLPLCLNTSTVRFRALDEKVLDIIYFKYYLQTGQFKDQLQKLITGSAQLNFGPSHLKQITIPLPALPEQRRIAALLDRADALRQKDRQLLANYDKLAQSVFLDFFGDPVRNEKGWEKYLLEELAEIVSGVTKNTKLNGNDFVEAPYMRVANVQDGTLNLSEIKTISVSRKEYEKYQLHSGDILLTEGGDPDKLGRGAVWHNEIENCIHQNHIFRLRPNKRFVDSKYLSTLIGSPYGKKYFLKAAKQTTGIASINITQLKQFPALIPPLSLQTHFARVIEHIERQKAVVRQQMAASEGLFGRLLQESFG